MIEWFKVYKLIKSPVIDTYNSSAGYIFTKEKPYLSPVPLKAYSSFKSHSLPFLSIPPSPNHCYLIPLCLYHKVISHCEPFSIWWTSTHTLKPYSNNLETLFNPLLSEFFRIFVHIFSILFSKLSGNYLVNILHSML